MPTHTQISRCDALAYSVFIAMGYGQSFHATNLWLLLLELQQQYGVEDKMIRNFKNAQNAIDGK